MNRIMESKLVRRDMTTQVLSHIPVKNVVVHLRRKFLKRRRMAGLRKMVTGITIMMEDSIIILQ